MTAHRWSKTDLPTRWPARTLEERFWAKVERGEGCWLWTASRTSTGYGQINVDHRPLKAHRVAWELTYGPIPDGLFVCHHCDVPLCCRPDHLFLGNDADNMRDCAAKGRNGMTRKTHCKYGHPFDEVNTKWVDGRKRKCRTCLRVQSLEHYYRTKR